MLISVLSLILLAVPAFSLPPTYPRPRRSARSVITQPVTWTTQFESLPADTDVRLSWSGGDGHGWQVYYIPQWHKQLEYEPIDIVRNTTSSSTIWRTPKKDAYPEGTSFIMGVNDGSKSVSGGWYDVSGLIPFVEPLEQPKHTQSRKGWIWSLIPDGSAGYGW